MKHLLLCAVLAVGCSVSKPNKPKGDGTYDCKPTGKTRCYKYPKNADGTCYKYSPEREYICKVRKWK